MHAVVQGASKLNMNPRVPEQPKKGLPRQVVYAPACVTRMMGPASSDSEQGSVHEKLLSLFDKAGYEVIYPEVSCPVKAIFYLNLCCLQTPASATNSFIGLQSQCVQILSTYH